VGQFDTYKGRKVQRVRKVRKQKIRKRVRKEKVRTQMFTFFK